MIKVLDRGYYYKVLCPNCLSTFTCDEIDFKDYTKTMKYMPIPTGEKYVDCPICAKRINKKSTNIMRVDKRGEYCQRTFEQECEEKGIDWNDLV